MLTKLFGILLSLLISSAAIAGNYPIKLENRQVGDEIQVIVHNNGHSPVSLRANLTEAVNVASDKSWPIYQVVQANSSTVIARIMPADAEQDIEFKTSMDSIPGLAGAIHDPAALYRLPYQDGSTYSIVQAPSGPRTTHTAPVNRFAIDFDMPEGTPIVAMRDGMVIQTQSRFSQGGKTPYYSDKANYVRILHADGTTAMYAHLMHEGVTVSPGQQVKAGALIGYSGSTGFSGGPHLHFAVTHIVKAEDGFHDVSVPVSFYVGNPARAFEPERGMLVKADYSAPDAAPDSSLIKVAIDQPLASAETGQVLEGVVSTQP